MTGEEEIEEEEEEEEELESEEWSEGVIRRLKSGGELGVELRVNGFGFVLDFFVSTEELVDDGVALLRVIIDERTQGQEDTERRTQQHFPG